MFRSIVVPNWVAKNANGYLNESNADCGKKILRHEKCWLIQTGLMSLKIAYYRVHSEWNGFETEMATFKTTYTLEPAKVSRDFDRFNFWLQHTICSHKTHTSFMFGAISCVRLPIEFYLISFEMKLVIAFDFVCAFRKFNSFKTSNEPRLS